MSENLPQFVVIGSPPGDCCCGAAHGASYLGPEHAGVPLVIDPKNPLAFGTPGATDEIGCHAVEHRHYVTDIHATVLQQLSLDAH